MAYIGFTVTSLNRRWLAHIYAMGAALRRKGPLTYFWKAIRKYGVECWDKKELFVGVADSMESISAVERRFISAMGTMAPNGYNLTEGGEGCVGCVRTDEFKEKMRQGHLGMKASDETRSRMSRAQKGRLFGKEHRKRLSMAQTGEKNHRFGKRHSEDEKLALSVKMSGENNPFYGKFHSLETRRIMRQNSNPRFGVNNKASRAVIVGSKRFGTMSEAARFVGISLAGMHGRVNSGKWVDCKYAEVVQ